MAHSQQLLAQTGIKASPPEMGTMQGKRTVSSNCCALEDSSGPLRANQGISRVEPREGDAVCTLRVHPPTSPYPAPVIAGSDVTR